MQTQPAGNVLILGFDPASIPNIDAEQVAAALKIGIENFNDSGLVPTECLVPLDESAVERIEQALTQRSYDCVVIGGGIRKPEPLLEFFETVVNLVRRHAPQATIAFNSDPTDSCAAARRAMANQR